MIADYDAILLAGGRASRLGGMNKPEMELGGRRLIDRSVAAAAGAHRVVAVGAVSVPDSVLLTCEDPAFGGPVAGLRAGIRSLQESGRLAPWLVVLACDLPDVEAAVLQLLAVAPGEHDGLYLTDAAGRPQWLLGCYRSSALLAALSDAGPDVTSVHRLLGGLTLLGIPSGAAVVDDVDTPDDVRRWLARLGKKES
jgi:molybdopterin-guanine dinucleotide biosynthesis protein A